MANALSCRYILLTQCDAHILGFALLKDLYAKDEFFNEIFAQCQSGSLAGSFFIDNGFLFKDGKLCIPTSSIHRLLTLEVRGSWGVS